MSATAPVSIPMYRAIHHDRKNAIIFIWYTNGTKDAFKAHHRFFSPYPGGKYNAMASGLTDIYGKSMYSSIVDSDTEMKARQASAGPYNDLSELDIDYRTRWLQNHYKDVGELRFSSKDINTCFLDIEVESGDRFPTATKADRRVNCVTIYLTMQKKYYTFGLQKPLKPETMSILESMNCEYRLHQTEKELITDLFTVIGNSDVDILSGYNSAWYDNPYLANRADQLGISLRPLSRLPREYKQAYISKKDGSLKIGGTEVIDYLLLYKKFSRGERDNYKLDTIGFEEVGERKAPLPEGYKSYINYWDDYVLYNIKDVELLKKIDEKRRMIETTVGACSEAKVPFGHIFEAKKMLVGFLLDILHKRNIVMPPLKDHEKTTFPGAFVYATPGFYESLVSYDYRSMYPSIMMGANISPETKVEFDINYKLTEEQKKALVRSPWTAEGSKQVYYTREIEGIVPIVVKTLFDGRTELKEKRDKAKSAGNKEDAAYFDMKQESYKLFGNSLYGLLGNEHFQLYDKDNAASITAFGSNLITSTIASLTKYMETEFENDPRYFAVFHSKPTLDKKIKGEMRLSHGDTDSFFVKYHDIYAPFKEKIGKAVQVIVFQGNKMIAEDTFNLPDGEKESKVLFNKTCLKYCPSWAGAEDKFKKKAFFNGIYKEGDFRIIYNRYSLTDYCRMLDAALMEEVLRNIMQEFSDKWNFRTNTLFIKREKCILQAIVTAKKKYICNVESNEDDRFEKTKFASTGMEIVRSSTPPFTRELIKELVTELLVSMNKGEIRDRYLEIKKQFFDITRTPDVYRISTPSGVKADPPDWTDMQKWPEEDKKKVDWRLRCASVWNHLIETDPDLNTQTLEPIFEGSKVKFINIVQPNRYNISKLAYTGNVCPPKILELFKPDWQDQWETTFAKTMGRLFEAIGWGKNLETDTRDLMAAIF